MKEFSFDHVWNLQDIFYEDRPLMRQHNQDVRTLLKRLEEESEECFTEVEKCMAKAGPEGVIDLCAQEIRQEISDLFLFVMAIAKCCGLTSAEMLADAAEKIAKTTGKYHASDYQDITADFKDKQHKSRSEDASRFSAESFYQIAA